MPAFQCDECGCIDNTALGWYWASTRKRLNTEETLGKVFCCVCMPKTFPDGTPVKRAGVWHNQFRRDFLPKGMFVLVNGSLVHKETGRPYTEYLPESPPARKLMDD